MTTDLWTEASRDVEAENRLKSLEMAKHASRGVWGFLAQAQDQLEYSDRLELARDQIESLASSTGAPVEDLLAVFEQRFALLTEASDNPFGNDDSDDSDDDDSDKDDDKSHDDKDSDSDDDDDDDDDSDDDDDDDDDKDDDDKDPDDDGDDDSSAEGDTDHDHGTPDDKSDDNDAYPSSGGDAYPAFGQGGGGKYSSLMQRIQAGENPLDWGGAPFGRSSARKTAAGAPDVVSDTNVPQGEANEGSVPPTPPALAETTKPRQLPGADSSGAPGGMDLNGEGGVDPALNGGDIKAGADTPPDDSSDKIASIAREVKQHNPHLSDQQCRKVASQVAARYYKQAEDLSPLLYGDRGNVEDGPLTRAIKNWEPPAPEGGVAKLPKLPGMGGDPKTPGAPSGPKQIAPGPKALMPGGGGAAAAAEELAPLLVL